MEFWLQKDDNNKFQLPITPADYKISVAHNNTVVNVVTLGDINLIGKTGLRELSLSSFFPARVYNFSNYKEEKDPKDYVNMLETWRLAGDVIRVIITGVLNMEVTIERFEYGEQDATGDIYYTLALKEYKRPKIQGSHASRLMVTRATKSPTTSSKRTYTVQKGDSLWKISKQFYGDGAQYNKIYNANSSKISNPDLIYAGQVLTIP